MHFLYLRSSVSEKNHSEDFGVLGTVPGAKKVKMWKILSIFAVIFITLSAGDTRPGFLRSNDQDLGRFNELIEDLVNLFEKGENCDT
jgi:hypothetical protein